MNQSPFCSVCGHKMAEIQYGATIAGSYIDWIGKECGDINLDICSECWMKILQSTETFP